MVRLSKALWNSSAVVKRLAMYNMGHYSVMSIGLFIYTAIFCSLKTDFYCFFCISFISIMPVCGLFQPQGANSVCGPYFEFCIWEEFYLFSTTAIPATIRHNNMVCSVEKKKNWHDKYLKTVLDHARTWSPAGLPSKTSSGVSNVRHFEFTVSVFHKRSL